MVREQFLHFPDRLLICYNCFKTSRLDVKPIASLFPLRKLICFPTTGTVVHKFAVCKLLHLVCSVFECPLFGNWFACELGKHLSIKQMVGKILWFASKSFSEGPAFGTNVLSEQFTLGGGGFCVGNKFVCETEVWQNLFYFDGQNVWKIVANLWLFIKI